jgi:hypothetical protein
VELVNVRPCQWDRCEETRPGELTITFWGSPHAGFGDVERVEVLEDAGRVVVTLYVGDDPEAAGWFTLVAAEQTAVAPLGRPLAGRPVVDGAASV